MEKLQVNDIFYSIQGEGKYLGEPQIFLRLQGCNFRCKWCDTREAWSRNGGVSMGMDKIIDTLKRFNCSRICVTGGEPLLQSDKLLHLLEQLKELNYSIVLETNGSMVDKEIFGLVDCVSADMKPPSSGMKSTDKILSSLKHKDQLKIIVKDKTDFDFAKEVLKRCQCICYLQPVGGINAKQLANWVLNDQLENVRVTIQLHKLMEMK
ncbi:MAG: 7-carboxy-7-deazaguanine synthase [Candidatus Methanoperedenaceae archaeon]|nr:MAG: 7-carboxy-7-deazaguanine synthase [Candidatus Methanoperedenaceae archaeon]